MSFRSSLHRSALSVLALAAVALTAGCTTFERRAKEKAPVFAALDLATQARLKEGHLALGDTLDMVYIALGEPEETRDQVATEGKAVVWIYRRHWQEYRGEAVVGYRSVSATDPKTGTPTVYYEPVQRSIYQDREEEHLRLVFKDGKLSEIEQSKS